ncbi:MAG: glycoside hydrolase family 5 protein [Lachnospiraceae bacterium]|nr:glycoside hydrolase family 5 protein [Lachnospiraceae bacterium]
MITKKITIKDGKFVDSFGKSVSLHGVNMVCKEKERGYIGEYGEEDFAKLEKMGFNVVRYGIFWAAVEPKPGEYDDEYLKKVDEKLKIAAEHGIYTYLDMHQDLFSSEYEDGAPLWATLAGGEKYEKTPLWSEAYLTSEAVKNCFDAFWSDAKICADVDVKNDTKTDAKTCVELDVKNGTKTDEITDLAFKKSSGESELAGIQTRFIKMWQHIADFFKDKPYVIGYDFFNEPFPGKISDMFVYELLMTIKSKLPNGEQLGFEDMMGMWMEDTEKLKLLDTFKDESSYAAIVSNIGGMLREFDSSILSAFYQKMRDAIREVDEAAILFLEANYFSNAGIESGIEVPENSDGEKDSLCAYSPHGYDLLVDTEDYGAECLGRLKVIFDTHKKVADRLGIPVLVGEWGCFVKKDAAALKQDKFLRELYDAYSFSETYYCYELI